MAARLASPRKARQRNRGRDPQGAIQPPVLFFLIVAIICVIITPFLIGIFWEENGHAISDWASGVLLQIHAALSQLTHMDGAMIHGFLFGLGLIAAHGRMFRMARRPYLYRPKRGRSTESEWQGVTTGQDNRGSRWSTTTWQGRETTIIRRNGQ